MKPLRKASRAILKRFLVWVCGRLDHGKVDVLETYTDNKSEHDTLDGNFWPHLKRERYCKMKCKCCGNIRIGTITEIHAFLNHPNKLPSWYA